MSNLPNVVAQGQPCPAMCHEWSQVTCYICTHLCLKYVCYLLPELWVLLKSHYKRLIIVPSGGYCMFCPQYMEHNAQWIQAGGDHSIYNNKLYLNITCALREVKQLKATMFTEIISSFGAIWWKQQEWHCGKLKLFFLHVSAWGPRSLQVFLPIKHDVALIMTVARRNSCVRYFMVEKHCYTDLYR